MKHLIALLAIVMLGWTAMASGDGGANNMPVPDFTRGGKKDDSHDWTLGPTGAGGFIPPTATRPRHARFW